MGRKPDLLIILAFLLCIGVVVTSYAGVLLEEKEIQGVGLKLSRLQKNPSPEFSLK